MLNVVVRANNNQSCRMLSLHHNQRQDLLNIQSSTWFTRNFHYIWPHYPVSITYPIIDIRVTRLTCLRGLTIIIPLQLAYDGPGPTIRMNIHKYRNCPLPSPHQLVVGMSAANIWGLLGMLESVGRAPLIWGIQRHGAPVWYQPLSSQGTLRLVLLSL